MIFFGRTKRVIDRRTSSVSDFFPCDQSKSLIIFKLTIFVCLVFKSANHRHYDLKVPCLIPNSLSLLLYIGYCGLPTSFWAPSDRSCRQFSVMVKNL